jgi:hypothetical protein
MNSGHHAKYEGTEKNEKLGHVETHLAGQEFQHSEQDKTDSSYHKLKYTNLSAFYALAPGHCYWNARMGKPYVNPKHKHQWVSSMTCL